MRARSKTLLMLAVVCSAALAGWTSQVAEPSQSPAPTHTAPPAEARVDINHATVEELMIVPGMTQTWAARIVRFRPYRTKQDLLDKGVLTSEVYSRVKDSLIAHHDKQ